MPSSNIKALRKDGKLQEAYDMAMGELQASPDNIWGKRNLSWVLYDYVKANNSIEHFSTFTKYLEELVALQLPSEEKMVFDNIAMQLGKMVFALTRSEHPDMARVNSLYRLSKTFHFTKPSEGYSFLFKAFHKAFKETDDYLDFADWWGLKNLRKQDFEKDLMPNGKPLISLAEQAYNAYSKHLLPKQLFQGLVMFSREKVEAFLPILDKVIEEHPEFQYPPYFKAKLLLAMGDKEDMLSALLPFVKKKRNDFWVWDVLSEAFENDEEKRIACFCRALSCKASDDFTIKVRQKLAHWMVSKQLYNEAKTEIISIVGAREANGWKIPPEILGWQEQPWYSNSQADRSNEIFYHQYVPLADALLYADTPEELVIIDFVNTDKSIANFVASGNKFGFFKFDRFFKKLQIGDTLKVRFNGGGNEGHFQLLTATKADEPTFSSQFIKTFEGPIRIGEGKSFGFVGDAFIHPSLVKKHSLQHQQNLKVKAIKSYNTEKKQWGWKGIEIEGDLAVRN